MNILDDDRPFQPFATGHIQCPECKLKIPVPVSARIVGGNAIQFDSDLTELWAHSWVHTNQ